MVAAAIATLHTIPTITSIWLNVIDVIVTQETTESVISFAEVITSGTVDDDNAVVMCFIKYFCYGQTFKTPATLAHVPVD